MRPPESTRWIFWDVDFDALDVEGDAAAILGRILERGRLEDVAWATQAYGLPRVHAFFRDVGHPELGPRTIAFWRAFFHAKDERWTGAPSSRTTSAALWPS